MKKVYTPILFCLFIAASSFITTTTKDINLLGESKIKVVRFYPNPATTYVVFEMQQTLEKGTKLQLFNSIGKKVDELAINSNKLTIGLENYYRGIYVFVLVDKNGKMLETGRFQVVK